MTVHGFRRLHPGPLAEGIDAALAELAERDAVARLWARDHTLWSDDPTELADRLGWLEVADEVLADGDRLDAVLAAAVADGFTHVVVMGMGGSSLFPEVLARTFGTVDGALELVVLDSTDPAAVARVAGHVPPEHTLFVASSKSGGTVETRSHLEFFWEHIGRPEQFAVVTDPGSDLGALARERGFREVFENRPDIGGRYSALSYFGLVPAALSGSRWRDLAASAVAAAPALRDPDPAVNAGLRLGALLAAGVRVGRDKLTIVLDPRIETFGLWLEQLIAESTGKLGTGVIPVVGESLGPADVYGQDRLFVAVGDVEHPVGLDVLADEGHPVAELAFDDLADLGAQALTWEVATALCGALLGINPFDQPNVAEAKEATNAVLADGAEPPDTPSLEEVLAQVQPGDYVAVMAYVDPEGPEAAELAERLRRHGHDVVGMDPGKPEADAHTLEELVPLLDAPGQPRVAWSMVPAGPITDQTVAGLADLLAPGDVVIDGGNSNYLDSIRHAEELQAKGIHFVDCGTSGGVWGLENGYALMVGGTPEAVAVAQPLFDALAPPKGFAHVGPPGSGHYVKMVHNGVEYGLMQAYAEGYAILEASKLDIDVEAAIGSWQEGSVVRSWLLDLLIKALHDTPDLEGIASVAADSGEGRWTVTEAVANGVSAPVISAALFARFVSQHREDDKAMKVISALRHQFGGHAIELQDPAGEEH